MLQFDHGLGHLKVEERLAALLFDGLHSRFDQRTVGDGEGEFGDDDVRQGFAADIHALPEGVHAEEHGFGRGAERFEQFRGGHAFALSKEGVAALPCPDPQLIRGPLQEGITRKQHERPAGGSLQDFGQTLHDLGLVHARVRGRVGHVPVEVQFDLFLEIERAAQGKCLGPFQTKPILHEGEAVLAAAGERGTRHHDRGHLIVKLRFEGKAHFDRGRAEGDADLFPFPLFNPIDVPGEFLAEPFGRGESELGQPFGAARQFDLLVFLGDVFGERVELVRQFQDRFAENVRHDVPTPDPARAAGLFAVPDENGGEEPLRRLPGVVEEFEAFGITVSGEDALVRPRGEELVEQVFDLPLAKAYAQVIGGDVFERVGLVEDHGLVVRKQTRVLPTQRQVTEEQRMVDDDQVGPVCGLAGGEVEAVVVIRALPAEAIAAVRFHQIPDGRHWLQRQVGPAAVFRDAGPPADGDELIDRGVVREQRGHTLLGDAEAAAAEVIAPAFDEGRPEVEREFTLQKRNVFGDELFLQGDGVRGDDDRQIFPCGHGLDRRHQVRERLANARAGLDENFLTVGDRPRHGLGHVDLLRARFKPRQTPGDQAIGTEHTRGSHAGIVGLFCICSPLPLETIRKLPLRLTP